MSVNKVVKRLRCMLGIGVKGDVINYWEMKLERKSVEKFKSFCLLRS